MKVRNVNARSMFDRLTKAAVALVLSAVLLLGGAVTAPVQASAATHHTHVSASKAKAARLARKKARAKARKIAARKAKLRRAAAKIAARKAKLRRVKPTGWRSAKVSWYGPGFYGHGMAGGGKLYPRSMVVAHRSLPFGTKIQFTYKGKSVTAIVKDRGPFVSGRVFDLGPGTAKALKFGGVGKVRYRILKSS
ncbi:MAG: septal ring lytic transglycosylase RlpA family protein [Coriobacteriia bacterium]|nr:septal ring lytic transglycosylase RlpA family protein [Coriobacteriia bacterium]